MPILLPGNAMSGPVFDPLSSRKRRLFILGAGFSAGAGLPMTGDLITAAMELLVREGEGSARGIEEKIRRAFRLEVHARFDLLSMAEICTQLSYYELAEARHNFNPWDRSKSPHLMALRFAIAKVIAQRTPVCPPDLYRTFARQLRDDDVVVSFNWDCLLEIAMDAEGISWHYRGSGRGVRLCKLHGSINWRRAESWQQTVEACRWNSMTRNEGAQGYGIQTTVDLLKSSPQWEKARPLGELSWEIVPLIVLPGYGKALDVRALADFWSLPSSPGGLMNTKGDVFVVGLSLAPDDFIIQSLFRDTLQHVEEDRRITIINPDPKALDNYSFLVGRPNVEFLCHPFGDADVTLMANSATDDRWQEERDRMRREDEELRRSRTPEPDNPTAPDL